MFILNILGILFNFIIKLFFYGKEHFKDTMDCYALNDPTFLATCYEAISLQMFL